LAKRDWYWLGTGGTCRARYAAWCVIGLYCELKFELPRKMEWLEPGGW